MSIGSPQYRHDPTDCVTDISEIILINEDVDNALLTMESLTKIKDEIMCTFDEEIDPISLKGFNMGFESAIHPTGFTDFEELTIDVEYTIESITGTIRAIWDKIIEVLSDLWKKISGFFRRLFGMEKKIESKLKNIVSEIEADPEKYEEKVTVKDVIESAKLTETRIDSGKLGETIDEIYETLKKTTEVKATDEMKDIPEKVRSAMEKVKGKVARRKESEDVDEEVASDESEEGVESKNTPKITAKNMLVNSKAILSILKKNGSSILSRKLDRLDRMYKRAVKNVSKVEDEDTNKNFRDYFSKGVRLEVSDVVKDARSRLTFINKIATDIHVVFNKYNEYDENGKAVATEE